MNIAFLGTGNVGAPIAYHLAEAGHDVVLAEIRAGSASHRAALARSKKLRSLPLAEAVAHADVVFLAIPYFENEGLLGPIAEQFAGKVLVDCTNPVGPGLSHGLKSERSGSEALQALVPTAKVVKAFSIYGFENFEDPRFASDHKAAMFFCGDDAGAKKYVASLIVDVGFEPLDVGGLVQALHLEHMTLLWVRLVRAQGHSPDLAWAALQQKPAAS